MMQIALVYQGVPPQSKWKRISTTKEYFALFGKKHQDFEVFEELQGTCQVKTHQDYGTS